MASTRLPGKVLKKVVGKPLLELEIERLQRVKLKDEIIVATTSNPQDDPIVALCEKLKVLTFRGSENDVLSRYYEAAREFKSDIIVRVTADCPLIDPDITNQIIQKYLESSKEYVSNTLIRTFPRGLDTEVFSFQCLEKVFNESKMPSEREHVTPYIYNNRDLFQCAGVESTVDCSRYRWTVDTPEDLELIKIIFEALYVKNPLFSTNDVCLMFDKHPEWLQVNKHIKQNPVEN